MQRQAMGVALHIVLLPFLNYCIAHLIRTTPAYPPAFFCPFASAADLFLCLKDIRNQEKGMQTFHATDPIPTDPPPIPEPIPRPQPLPEPDPPYDPEYPPIIDPPPHR
ncbi:hypothetical protein CTZ24_10635 [Pantoea phytobeneficialis]|uniref:Uncharacterized protein n=2 Tax=Pantoea phytobeneficialis TaxID=2052056 RepID=A0AAP9H504_9GAMM|nr:hypothetical protein CTZ24_10635 [Pantoea phytobeneficialis]